LLKLCKGGVTIKKKGDDFEMKILHILNENSTRYTENFQGVEKRLQQILFLNLNPFSQTNFVILTLWTSRDQTSLNFLSRSQLVVDECGSSSFNNKIPQMLPQHHYIISLKN
jgi:hypothetical protein